MSLHINRVGCYGAGCNRSEGRLRFGWPWRCNLSIGRVDFESRQPQPRRAWTLVDFVGAGAAQSEKPGEVGVADTETALWAAPAPTKSSRRLSNASTTPSKTQPPPERLHPACNDSLTYFWQVSVLCKHLAVCQGQDDQLTTPPPGHRDRDRHRDRQRYRWYRSARHARTAERVDDLLWRRPGTSS